MLRSSVPSSGVAIAVTCQPEPLASRNVVVGLPRLSIEAVRSTAGVGDLADLRLVVVHNLDDKGTNADISEALAGMGLAELKVSNQSIYRTPPGGLSSPPP